MQVQSNLFYTIYGGNFRIIKRKQTIPFQNTDAGRPNGRKRDCVVRALSLALEISYELAEKFLADNGRRLNRGVHTAQILGRQREVLGKLLTNVIPENTQITLGQFLKRYPTGSFICRKNKHAFAVKNGVVLDRMYIGAKTQITHAWQVTEIKPEEPKKEINTVDFSPKIAFNRTMKLTIKQLAAKTGQDYLATTGMVKFLINKGLAKEVGKEERPEGAKGKPSLIYELPEKVELSF